MQTPRLRSESDPSSPVPTDLVGIGPHDQFALASTIRSQRVAWHAAYESVDELGRDMVPRSPFVLLLDGDFGGDALINLLEEYMSLVARNATILQITKPPVRLAVLAMQRGVLDILVKPVSPGRLDAVLKDALVECDSRRRCRARH